MAHIWKGPPRYYVFVTVAPTKSNGLLKSFTSRIGSCREKGEIAKLIADDKKAMNQTFGGLIDASGSSGRTYRAFKAEWTELEI